MGVATRRPLAAWIVVSVATSLIAGVPASPVWGQALVRGTVLEERSLAPLSGATLKAGSAPRVASSDQFGRFAIWVGGFPDTLTVVAIGRRPTAIVLADAPSEPLRIVLAPAVTVLSDVIVSGDAAGSSSSDDVGRWRTPATAIRSVPPAVEPDVFRALVLVPAVSFTSPLSARPLIRGFDAGESSLRIDGFEVLNLYHLGRAFSAFPAEAAAQVEVATAPQSTSLGQSLSGTIDILGRTGTADKVHGGASVSLASASTWAGGGQDVRWFGAARAVHLSALDAVSNTTIPYDFQDVYANLAFGPAEEPRGKVVVFSSRDHLFESNLGSGMDWSNILVGSRWNALERPGFTVAVAGSATRFSEDVANIEARRSRIDVRNRFGRVLGEGEVRLHLPTAQATLGLTLGHRAVQNRIVPVSGEDFQLTDVDLDRLEISAFAGWSQQVNATSLEVGVRTDVAGDVAVWQPRLRALTPLGGGVSVGVSAGRTARLYHLVSDPQSEPDLAFYDFWLNAGEENVPVPVADHGSLELNLSRGALNGRLSVFGSRARGLVELRPETDQSSVAGSPFRFGKGRSRGVEVQIALRGSSERASSLSLAYVFARTDRAWEGGDWRPWVQDRRHTVRVLGQTPLSSRFHFFAAVEGSSAAPLTPVSGVINVGGPDPEDGGIVRGPGVGRPSYLYGLENSGRGSGTWRADVGTYYRFKGPWRTSMEAGLSIINLGFGPVAALRPVDPAELLSSISAGTPTHVRYERLYDLPAVPTLTLRMEF